MPHNRKSMPRNHKLLCRCCLLRPKFLWTIVVLLTSVYLEIRKEGLEKHNNLTFLYDTLSKKTNLFFDGLTLKPFFAH